MGLGLDAAVNKQTRALHKLLRVSSPASTVLILPAEPVQP